MPKLCRVIKVNVNFLFLVLVFHFNLFEFSATILEKGLLTRGGTHRPKFFDQVPRLWLPIRRGSQETNFAMSDSIHGQVLRW